METEAIQWIAIGALLMDKATNLALRIFGFFNKRNNKKKTDAPELGNPGSPDYGERIKGCETEIKNLKEANKEDHRLIRAENKEDCELIRKDISKLFTLSNKAKNGTRK